jgi:hypothetical protein
MGEGDCSLIFVLALVFRSAFLFRGVLEEFVSDSGSAFEDIDMPFELTLTVSRLFFAGGAMFDTLISSILEKNIWLA